MILSFLEYKPANEVYARYAQWRIKRRRSTVNVSGQTERWTEKKEMSVCNRREKDDKRQYLLWTGLEADNLAQGDTVSYSSMQEFTDMRQRSG